MKKINKALSAYKKTIDLSKKETNTDTKTKPAAFKFDNLEAFNKDGFQKTIKPEPIKPSPVIKTKPKKKHERILHVRPTAVGKEKVAKGLVEEALKDDKSYRKIAKFLILIGQDEASKVLTHLSKGEIALITREIATIKKISNIEAQKILKDFGAIVEKLDTERGGVDIAKDMLLKAFGKEKGENILNKVVPYADEKPFSFFEDLEFDQILLLLKNEPSSVVSIIVPYLDKDKASKILEALSPELQKQVAIRIAKMSEVNPMVLAKMEENLKEKIRNVSHHVSEEMDGKKALTDILKYMDFDNENKIIESFSDTDPEIYQDIKERLFNIDIILHIGDKSFERVLREFEEKEIALLLKGKSEVIKEKIFGNISARKKDLVQIEYEVLGPVRKKEVDDFTKEFLDYLMQLEEQGSIIIKKVKDEYI